MRPWRRQVLRNESGRCAGPPSKVITVRQPKSTGGFVVCGSPSGKNPDREHLVGRTRQDFYSIQEGVRGCEIEGNRSVGLWCNVGVHLRGSSISFTRIVHNIQMSGGSPVERVQDRTGVFHQSASFPEQQMHLLRPGGTGKL